MPRLLFHAPSLAAALALFAALLLSGPALSALRLGTNGNDILIGTPENDQLTGLGGNDVLKGKPGNDIYYFSDNWGSDILVEKAGEGLDTVSFRGVKTCCVTTKLVPEWVPMFGSEMNRATGPGGVVRFGYSVEGEPVESIVENVIGSLSGDNIVAGGGKNILQPGGGAVNFLRDLGGYNDGRGGNPTIPASNDIYKGFANTINTGTAPPHDYLQDWGGSGDVLDLRPFSTEDVFIAPISNDGGSATLESLQIVTGVDSQIIVRGQFGDYAGCQAQSNCNGRIETIIFADTTITDIVALQALTIASTEAPSRKQVRLAAAAERLAHEAQTVVDWRETLGFDRPSGGRDAASASEITRLDRQHKHDKGWHKHDRKHSRQKRDGR